MAKAVERKEGRRKSRRRGLCGCCRKEKKKETDADSVATFCEDDAVELDVSQGLQLLKKIDLEVVIPEGGKPGMKMNVPTECHLNPSRCPPLNITIPKDGKPGDLLTIKAPKCKCRKLQSKGTGMLPSMFSRKKSNASLFSDLDTAYE